MKVKLQPPSGTELAPFNPILPPASITQIMLLANPTKVGDIVKDINTAGSQAGKSCGQMQIKMVVCVCVCVCTSSQEKVRLRYKLAFTLGDRLCNEVGEVDQFPPQETWGHL